MKVISTNRELTNLGALVIVNDSAKNCQVCNLIPAAIYNADSTINEIATLTEVLHVCYNIASANSKLNAYFEAFKNYGIFVPNDARDNYFSCVRRNQGNAIMICTEISDPYIDAETGNEVTDYTFEALIVSEVKLSHTAFGMNAKTLKAFGAIKHEKGWRIAARGLKAQFEVLSIKEGLKAGTVEVISADQVEKEAEIEAPSAADNTAPANI